METVIRTLDCVAGQGSDCEGAIEDIYADRLDAVIVRGAFPPDAIADVEALFRDGDPTAGWNRPNRPMPPIDLRLVGVGAAPCATAPLGPGAAEYFDAAQKTAGVVRSLFSEGFDPIAAVESTLRSLSGTPAAIPAAADGRSYSACTVRAIPDGAGLMLHHDSHYGLDIYADMLPQLDSSLLLSFFVVLQRPESGGRLCVYRLGPAEDGEMPRLDNGMLDPQAFHEQVPHDYFDLSEGDMLVFGSARLYHRVETVSGPRSRVTLGGFLGLDRDHRRCLYWS